MSEHPSITFIPDGPGDEEGEGGQGTPVGDVSPSTIFPPIQDGIMKMPSGVLSILHSRPHTVLDKHNRVVIFP